ncbi:MAG: glutathione S-transferase family protein [Proteobacteria bacterium]|nr:glutathione S-transferase family protein [Pseudomonadota bacterium]
MIELHDLAAGDPAVRFSPYCWRTKLALAHKGLAVTTIPWRFTDPAPLPTSGSAKVPVIHDGNIVVADSWTIASDLEARYPDRPSLFNGSGGMAHARLINHWADTTLHPGLLRLVVADLWASLSESDKPYFRQSREARFGKRLEDLQANRDTDVVGFRQSLTPMRATLVAQPWLGGDTPSYADYILAGTFMWARSASAFQLLEASDPVHAWRERMLDLHDGLGRKAPTPAK